MSESQEIPAATPKFKAAQRWNIVWVVPILALLIGGWLVWHNIASKGPIITVTFETADGISVGKTEVRCRSVRVGFVDDVDLSDDLKSVKVAIRIDPEAQDLLRKGSNFWVVRPRVSGTDISGLGTFLTGAYIELDPGPPGDAGVKAFVGKERPPVTSSSVPGRRLVLSAEEAGSLIQGSPVYYRGYEVGRIESRELLKDGSSIKYDVFIQQDYGWLVTENTRFWNTSGIDVTMGADGVKLRTPSFQAMVSGGAEFGVPPGIDPGAQVVDGKTFTLYKNFDAAVSSAFAPTMRFLLLFDQTVRGLTKGAPVEFRGISIGRVADVSMEYNDIPGDSRIPVLIEIDPSALRAETREKINNPDSTFLAEAVAKGLRASLKTGSLLTGAKYVDLDYYAEAQPAQMTHTGQLTTIPTVSSGLEQLETKITAILDKIQALPLDETMKSFSTAADESKATLREIQATAAAARETLESPEFKSLPGDLKATLQELEKSVSSIGPDGSIQGDLLRTLDELRATLRSIKAMTNEIAEKPSSLLWDKDSSGNPMPKAPKKR